MNNQVQVQFLQDYRGKLTGERFYQAGDATEFDESTARQLAERNIIKIASAPVGGKAKR